MRGFRLCRVAFFVLGSCSGIAVAGIPDTVWLDDYESCGALQSLCPDADADDFGDAPWCFVACQQPYDFFPIPATDCNDDDGAINPGAAEVCNGIDDDCDTAIDLADANYQAPNNFCLALGECAGTAPTCTGAGGTKCFYTDPDVELQPNGEPVINESLCDSKDNNCNGAIDESYPLKGTACDTGLPGVCAAGTNVCNPQRNGLRCAQNIMAKTEKCGDGLDNDCDGMVDEPGCAP